MKEIFSQAQLVGNDKHKQIFNISSCVRQARNYKYHFICFSQSNKESIVYLCVFVYYKVIINMFESCPPLTIRHYFLSFFYYRKKVIILFSMWLYVIPVLWFWGCCCVILPSCSKGQTILLNLYEFSFIPLLYHMFMCIN